MLRKRNNSASLLLLLGLIDKESSLHRLGRDVLSLVIANLYPYPKEVSAANVPLKKIFSRNVYLFFQENIKTDRPQDNNPHHANDDNRRVKQHKT